MIWKTLVAALVFVGLCVVGMCFNIIFRKNGKFPETEISRNPEMRKRGITCAKEEELGMLAGRKGESRPRTFDCGDCTACELFKTNKKSEEI